MASRKRKARTPVILIAGPSGSGKTSLLEKLIRELSRRGLRVGAVKGTRHPLDLDHPGKDSWRLARAGAAVVAVSSPGSSGIIRHHVTGRDLPRLLSEISGETDVVLVEGFKGSRYPKIVVLRKGAPAYPWRRDRSVVALASDHPVRTDLPLFPLGDAAAICDFILEGVVAPPSPSPPAQG